MKVRIRARFYNEDFRAARIDAGFRTVRDMHNGTGISLGTIYRYENFMAYPRTPKMIRRIERAIGLPIDDLFPQVCKDATDRKLGRPLERVLAMHELPEWAGPKMLAMPHNVVQAHEMREGVERALDTLTEREADVLRKRFGIPDGNEHTLEEIAYEYRLSRERIRCIEAKALRKLKHSSRRQNLRGHLSPGPKRDRSQRMRKVWPGYAIDYWDFKGKYPLCINISCQKFLIPMDKWLIVDLRGRNYYLLTPPEVEKRPKDFLYCEHCCRIYRRYRQKKYQEEIGKA